ncbi:MAG: membrane protein insertion efficiency factor YidD [Bacteroidales bacterium]
MSGRVNILSLLLMVPVKLYQWFLSPLLGPSCRHVPSCSSYTIDALKMHGPWKGFLLGTNRILRCRPGGTHGYDPVPKILFRSYKPFSSLLQRRRKSSRLKDH